MTPPSGEVSFDDITRFLQESTSYPEGGPVERIETHISVVFLTPTHAWKLLKPIDFGFLDFSTRAARFVECWNEVRLNRRLAADVYLGVVPITVAVGGHLELGGVGRPVDWGIRMHRLPDDATLESRVLSGAAVSGDVDRALDVLCPFFRAAETGPSIDADERPVAIRGNVLENLETLDRHVHDGDLACEPVQQLYSAQLQMLELHATTFEQRIAEGRIRNGHGDLKAEHVYLTDSPVIVDCIAFNERFRHVDTLDEICFLASDLERLGRPDLGDRLVARYRSEMHDDAPPELEAFFRSYRLTVRAKVGCLRGEGQTGNDRRASFAEAERLARDAVDVMRSHHQPLLVVICGTSGSGKSTIARALAERLGARRVSSDEVRKELFGVSATDHSADSEMLYSADAGAKTYAGLIDQARSALQQGVSVILDATWQRRTDRVTARALASEAGVPILFVECRCSVDVARERIERRAREGTDASDADFAVLESQSRNWEPLDDVSIEQLETIDTEGPADASVAQIVSRLAVV